MVHWCCSFLPSPGLQCILQIVLVIFRFYQCGLVAKYLDVFHILFHCRCFSIPVLFLTAAGNRDLLFLPTLMWIIFLATLPLFLICREAYGSLLWRRLSFPNSFSPTWARYLWVRVSTTRLSFPRSSAVPHLVKRSLFFFWVWSHLPLSARIVGFLLASSVGRPATVLVAFQRFYDDGKMYWHLPQVLALTGAELIGCSLNFVAFRLSYASRWLVVLPISHWLSYNPFIPYLIDLHIRCVKVRFLALVHSLSLWCCNRTSVHYVKTYHDMKWPRQYSTVTFFDSRQTINYWAPTPVFCRGFFWLTVK